MVKYAGIYSSPLKSSCFIECSLKELNTKDLVFFGLHPMCSMVLFGPQAVSSHNSSLFQLEALLWVMSDLESYPLNALGNVKLFFFCNI